MPSEKQLYAFAGKKKPIKPIVFLGASPQKNSTSSGILLFQKRSKSVSSASQKTVGYLTLGEADPEKLYVERFLLFQKRSKSVSSASQKTVGYPTFGEADPGGLGACPQKNSTLSGILLFQKRSKSISSALRNFSLQF
jgi:hypothetical protein